MIERSIDAYFVLFDQDIERCIVCGALVVDDESYMKKHLRLHEKHGDFDD